ncbi:MAG: glycosyltransferase family 39 protein [Hyphomonadaceae bacterium]|nr:glycosyltransferase family 39 protein [Hyphomonadaceae bacterium]
MPSTRAAFDRATLAFAIVLVAVTWLRIAILRVNGFELYFDEAQYWAWSRSFDWGYFSKPPLVAWVIAATTALFGDAEWAVRLGAPIGQAIAASALFALGRSMYGAWPGFWAGLGWLMLPGVFVSSGVISTDAVMLPFWALGMFALWRLTNTRAWAWAILLGVFVGVGTLAKYAMLYFFICAALAAWWVLPVREGLAKGRGIVAALTAAAIMAPNLVWNFQNGFATARHTASNARLDPGDLFNVDELIEFIGGQAGVIGPLLFLVLVWALWRAMGRTRSREDDFLLAFMLPALAFVTALSFLSRANANWVAVSYPAIVVWVTGLLFGSRGGRRLLVAATTVNLLLASAFAGVIALRPDLATQVKGVRETRGWAHAAREIAQRASAQPGDAPFTAVMVDDRALFFELNYYWRDAREGGAALPPLRMWRLHAEAGNSAEAVDPMRVEEGGRVLIVHMRGDYLPLIAADFTVFRRADHLSIPLGGDYARELDISVGEGFAPVARDEAFEERLRGRNER